MDDFQDPSEDVQDFSAEPGPALTGRRKQGAKEARKKLKAGTFGRLLLHNHCCTCLVASVSHAEKATEHTNSLLDTAASVHSKPLTQARLQRPWASARWL